MVKDRFQLGPNMYSNLLMVDYQVSFASIWIWNGFNVVINFVYLF
jgi:hypothetical protein